MQKSILDDIFNFISGASKRAAIDTYNTILDEIDHLVQQPKIASKELFWKSFRTNIVRL